MKSSTVVSGVLVCCVVWSAQAERPACYQLLPSKTLAYVRVADVKELGEKFNETAVGRMIQQQQLKSLTQQLFEEAEVAFTPVAEEIGLTIAELLAIPQGELAAAVTAPPNGFPAPVLMMDIEGQEANAQKLLDVLSLKLEEEGFIHAVERIGRVELSIHEQGDERWTGIISFQRDSMLVVTSNIHIARQIIAAWDGDDEQLVLQDNADFADVMRHSKGPRGAAPQIRWFVDPVSLAKVSFRGNMAAQTGLAMLPVVGADGILALGGSITMASDEYDAFVQAHLITAEPRTGVLAALAMTSGDPTPEDWVPHDVASYQTMYWNFDRTLAEATVLYNSFRGEEAFANEIIKKVNAQLDIDVEEQVLDALDGRLSLATWFTKPARINGAAYLGGVRIKEDVAFKATIEHVVQNSDNNLEEETFAGVTIYSVPIAGDEDPDGPLIHQFCFAVLDNYLLLSNNPNHIERAIVARNNPSKSLQNELDFKLVASKARRQPGGKSPGRFVFDRPEESFRMLYDLATAESTRERLADGAEGNELLGKLNRALEDNPLPPFASLRKFFAPTGAIMTADDTGFHYIGFGLRRKK